MSDTAFNGRVFCFLQWSSGLTATSLRGAGIGGVLLGGIIVGHFRWDDIARHAVYIQELGLILPHRKFRQPPSLCVSDFTVCSAVDRIIGGLVTLILPFDISSPVVLGICGRRQRWGRADLVYLGHRCRWSVR